RHPPPAARLRGGRHFAGAGTARGRAPRLRGGGELGAPAVLVSHFDHGGEDVVPGLLFGHDFVGEHAAVPADVFEFFGEVAFVVAEPEAGDVGDVELAGGVGGHAMAAGFVVGAGAVDGAVVLGDVEVDRPWPQGRGQL